MDTWIDLNFVIFGSIIGVVGYDHSAIVRTRGNYDYRLVQWKVLKLPDELASQSGFQGLSGFIIPSSILTRYTMFMFPMFMFLAIIPASCIHSICRGASFTTLITSYIPAHQMGMALGENCMLNIMLASAASSQWLDLFKNLHRGPLNTVQGICHHRDSRCLGQPCHLEYLQTLVRT